MNGVQVMFPGVQVEKSRTVMVVDKLFRRLNPRSLSPFDLMQTWTKIAIKKELCQLLTEERYYILYKHPVHPHKDKLFDAERHDLQEFLLTRFDERKMEGIDLIVFSLNMNQIIVGNHDGELYSAI